MPAPATKQSARSQQARSAAEERPGSTRRTDESMGARAERKASPREPDSSARAERKAAEREADSEPAHPKGCKIPLFGVQKERHTCSESTFSRIAFPRAVLIRAMMMCNSEL